MARLLALHPAVATAAATPGVAPGWPVLRTSTRDTLVALARWQPQNLACERHRVQGALQADELARQQADTHRQLAAASDHIAESLTRSVFWSQVVAAGLAIWMLG